MPQGDRKHVRVWRRQTGWNTSRVVISFHNRQYHVLCCVSVYTTAEERYIKYLACMLHILCTDGVGRRTCTNVQSKTVDLRYLYLNSGFKAGDPAFLVTTLLRFLVVSCRFVTGSHLVVPCLPGAASYTSLHLRRSFLDGPCQGAPSLSSEVYDNNHNHLSFVFLKQPTRITNDRGTYLGCNM